LFAISNLSYPAMNVLPCCAQHLQVTSKDSLDLGDFPSRESVIFPNLNRSRPAIQMDYSLATSANDMNLCRPVVIRINHCAQSIKSQRGRHNNIPSYPKRLGYWDACTLMPAQSCLKNFHSTHVTSDLVPRIEVARSWSRQ
jgi:hypothetical protein